MMNFKEIVAAVCLIGTALAQSKFKILPLGDSITELTCWRAKLWDHLKANNAADRVEFVGSVNNTQQCDLVDPDFAIQHHEGHTGYLAIDIAYDHAEKWINNTQPDIVMWMLGTDDIVQGRRLEAVIDAYTDIVDTARQYNGGMKIIVNTVVPLPANMYPVENLNGMIPGWAMELNTTGSPVYVNDIYPFPNNLLRDGIHPNDEGDDLIAGGLSSLLTWIINSNTTEIQ